MPNKLSISKKIITCFKSVIIVTTEIYIYSSQNDIFNSEWELYIERITCDDIELKNIGDLRTVIEGLSTNSSVG